MKISDAYLLGSDVLGGVAGTVQVDMPDDGDDGDAISEAERLIEQEEVEERRALRPFEAKDGYVRQPERLIKSEVPGIADRDWTRFVLTMKTANPSAVSASNALGMFEMKPRRLADLGLMKNLRCTRSPTGRLVWIGEFASPLTQKKFLEDPAVQYRAFCDSMKKYIDGIVSGSIDKPDNVPQGMTLSGALAVLHRCGPSGLKSWDASSRFPETIALYDKANRIF